MNRDGPVYFRLLDDAEYGPRLSEGQIASANLRAALSNLGRALLATLPGRILLSTVSLLAKLPGSKQ